MVYTMAVAAPLVEQSISSGNRQIIRVNASSQNWKNAFTEVKVEFISSSDMKWPKSVFKLIIGF